MTDKMPIELNTNVPHPARVYDYFLGGKDHFTADQEAGEAALAVAPGLRDNALANRAFMVRAVRYLAEQAGIRQFIDVGTGLPTHPNVHEVAQAVDPTARVVYVDNDPIVLAHARALLTSSPEGATAYIDADLHDPTAILADPDLQRVIDFGQPVAILLVAILHHLADADDPAGIVARLLAPTSPGSYLVLSQMARDINPDGALAVSASAERDGVTLMPRWRAEILRFFDGLELVEPGLVQVVQWRPEVGEVTDRERKYVWVYGGVARKP
jgi:hypothetical protein